MGDGKFKMTKKIVEQIVESLSQIPQRTTAGMIYQIRTDGENGAEFLAELSEELNTKNNNWNVFGPPSDFDNSRNYKILRGYSSTIVNISDVRGKTIVKEERPKKNFNLGEVIEMSFEGNKEYVWTKEGSFGKITDVGSSKIWASFFYFPNECPHKNPTWDVRTEYVKPYALIINEAEVSRTNFMIKIFPDLSIRVYPTERGLYGEKISLEEALKEERLRSGIEGFLDVWNKDFDKFEIKPYGGRNDKR